MDDTASASVSLGLGLELTGACYEVGNQHNSIRRSLRLLSITNQIFWIGGARIPSGAFVVRRCGIYPYLELVIEFVGDEIRKTSN
ncbi:hypothetical protein TorRG33x02_082100 [Trema orientale]|uniref:Uncharacterized protein n=1 Tax=Trema orientale TaxID=63057 RepID=A0A2P5FDU6_TREOI|nr:hypothetical protein TorRG33x02_082100 [Trema orientale]